MKPVKSELNLTERIKNHWRESAAALLVLASVGLFLYQKESVIQNTNVSGSEIIKTGDSRSHETEKLYRENGQYSDSKSNTPYDFPTQKNFIQENRVE